VVVEYLLKIAGEMCVHFVIVIGTSLAIAYYLENLQDASSIAKSFSEVNTDVLSTTTTADLISSESATTTIQNLQETVADAIVTAIANITEQGVESEL